MGEQGADEHERSHARRHATAGRVDFLHDEIAARVRILSEVVVDHSDSEAAEREEKKQPRIFPAETVGVIESPQKECAGRTGKNGDWEDEQRPSQEMAQISEVLAIVEKLFHRPK